MEASNRAHVITVTLSINVLVEYSAETASYNTYHETDSNRLIDANSHRPRILPIHIIPIIPLHPRETKHLIKVQRRLIRDPDLEIALRSVIGLPTISHGHMQNRCGDPPTPVRFPHCDGDHMTETGGPQTPEFGEPPLDTAHDISLNPAISLSHDKSLRETPIEIPVKELAVILWEAFHVNVHHPA